MKTLMIIIVLFLCYFKSNFGITIDSWYFDIEGCDALKLKLSCELLQQLNIKRFNNVNSNSNLDTKIKQLVLS